MQLRLIFCTCLAAFTLVAPAAAGVPAPSPRLGEDGFLGYSASFVLKGTNGYRIGFIAYSERPDGRGRLSVATHRKGESAFYSAPAIVSQDFVKADLGPLGKVDLAVRPSGRERTLHIKCSRESYPFEPISYEGMIEFRGEEGYTQVRAQRASLLPFPTSLCSGSGTGESTGGDGPGARLRGVSYAHGRALTFQVNKNRPRALTVWEASLRERRDGILIQREVHGASPASAFRFPRDLQTATLSPPAPFSGSASLAHAPNSVNPLWTGGLTLDFPGRSNVPLAGALVHVSLVHARFNCSDGGYAEITFRPRCGMD
jgi:hypothetical protein